MAPRDPRTALYAAAWPRLFGIAAGWTRGNEAEAEDLAQQALLRALTLASGAPIEVRGLVAVAATLMRGELSNRVRAEQRRRDPRWLPIAAAAPDGAQSTPEDVAAARELAAQREARLEESLARDPLARAIVRATMEGCDTPAEQAALLGEEIDAIRNARKRVARAMSALLAAEREGERQGGGRERGRRPEPSEASPPHSRPVHSARGRAEE